MKSDIPPPQSILTTPPMIKVFVASTSESPTANWRRAIYAALKSKEAVSKMVSITSKSQKFEGSSLILWKGVVFP